MRSSSLHSLLLLSLITLLLLHSSCIKSISPEQKSLLNLIIRPHLDSNLTAKYYDIDVTFGIWVTSGHHVYFYLSPDESFAEARVKMLLDTADYEVSPCDGEACKWGGMSIKPTEKLLFRTHDYNLRVPAQNLGLRFDQSKQKPNWSLQEIAGQNDTQYYYNFKPFIFDEDTSLYYINHARYISPKGNKFLQKFMKERAGNSTDLDTKVETLFSFITDSIHYIYVDDWYQTDLGILPYETLISCRGDCSAKSVLFASLLEQLGVDYTLLFYPGHMNVGVTKQNPTPEDKHYIRVDDKKYYIAETTVPQFEIGKGLFPDTTAHIRQIIDEQIEKTYGKEQVLYTQTPKKDSTPIYFGRNTYLLGVEESDLQ